MQATSRVLRSACAAQDCAGDPVADLAAVVRRDGGGPDLLGLIGGMSAVRPAFDTLLPALRRAQSGDRSDLDRLLEAYRTGFATSPCGVLRRTAQRCLLRRPDVPRGGARRRRPTGVLRRYAVRSPGWAARRRTPSTPGPWPGAAASWSAGPGPRSSPRRSPAAGCGCHGCRCFSSSGSTTSRRRSSRCGAAPPTGCPARGWSSCPAAATWSPPRPGRGRTAARDFLLR